MKAYRLKNTLGDEEETRRIADFLDILTEDVEDMANHGYILIIEDETADGLWLGLTSSYFTETYQKLEEPQDDGFFKVVKK